MFQPIINGNKIREMRTDTESYVLPDSA